MNLLFDEYDLYWKFSLTLYLDCSLRQFVPLENLKDQIRTHIRFRQIEN